MRYIIGIDLGTTNCAVSFIDTEQPALPLQIFSIPQLSAPGKVIALPTLPSFCYLPGEGEWSPQLLQLPWKYDASSIVGQFAKIQGARVPTRLIQSAKSWLCHVGANRRDKILPVDAANLSQRLSPVEASSKYLEHLRDAWNAAMAKGNPDFEFEEQEIILTVPASFDEVARALTVEAARKAGLMHVNLIEEPQAAFYSWISQHEHEWENLFKEGDSVLICDVGGGTTDFSLIQIEQQGEKLAFQRIAVGDHLLLGGDNIDAALAHFLENKILQSGYPRIESHQWMQLLAEARQAKETLLKPEISPEETCAITLWGTGSSVVKGSLSVTVSRKEVEELLLNGFFGCESLQEALQLRRSRGMRTMGLPYEDEPSITKHLAHFLKQAHFVERNRGVDYILFNGGSLKPEVFQQAIEKALHTWFPGTTLARLDSSSLDLAVARGAAYYGKVRRGWGVSIGGGLPRTYYLQIDVKDAMGRIAKKALTLLPKGTQEGKIFQSPQTFSLRSNIPVAFHLLTSHVRLHDREGDLIEIDSNEMQPLPPIQTILRFGKKQTQAENETIPVCLLIRLTEIGTVEMWLESQISEHRWQLEFQLRSVQGQDSSFVQSDMFLKDVTFEKGYLEKAKQELERFFHPGSSLKPSQIMENLETQIGMNRREWGPTLLRDLWESLVKIAPHRKLSAEHESRWWNLAGFFLRPGFGFPLDDFRMKEFWKIVLSELKTPKNSECQIQIWICLRRIAGGLNKGQQMQAMSELIGTVLDKKNGKIEVVRKGEHYHYSEKMRALASLERLDLSFKSKLGDALVDRLLHSPTSCDFWALARIGARHLLYGSAGQVVPKEIAAKWIERLLQHPMALEHRDSMLFLLGRLAGKTDHRELNLPESVLQQIINAYPDERLKEILREEKELTQSEREFVFGDQLPAGLCLNEMKN